MRQGRGARVQNHEGRRPDPNSHLADEDRSLLSRLRNASAQVN
jgi:hypothetical protein